jgi:hypothetical protein
VGKGLRPLIALALAACALTAGAQPKPKCAVTEKMVEGPWQSVKGGSFEEFALEREDGKRVFNSWLHQRPEYSGGEWVLEDCRLSIRIPSANTSFEYASVRVAGSRLYLREEGERAEAVYKRIK